MNTNTEADLARAEREAAEASEQLRALEEAVVAGDQKITAEDIQKQESLARFARLRVQATQRRIEEAAEASRLSELALVAEEANAGGALDEIAAAWDELHDAAAKFFAAVRDRNDQVAKWHGRMRRNGVRKDVDTHGYALPRDRESSVIRINARMIAAIVNPYVLVSTAIHNAAKSAGVPAAWHQGTSESIGAREAVMAKIRQYDRIV